MREKLHHDQHIKSGCDVIEHNPRALWEFFQLAHGRGLDDVKGSKKYKTRKESFPFERGSDEGNELSGHFVDYHELGIFPAGGSGDLSGGWDADERNQNREGNDSSCSGTVGDEISQCGPEEDGGGGSPGARSGP